MPISRLMMLGVDIRTPLLNVRVAAARAGKWITANYASDAHWPISCRRRPRCTLNCIAPEHTAQREAAMAASRSFVAMGCPLRRKPSLPLIGRSATLSGSHHNRARHGPCRPRAAILVIMKEARDLTLPRSCWRETGERSRVFEEFPLDFGRETTP
jgi:hypothetical protein